MLKHNNNGICRVDWIEIGIGTFLYELNMHIHHRSLARSFARVTFAPVTVSSPMQIQYIKKMYIRTYTDFQCVFWCCFCTFFILYIFFFFFPSQCSLCVEIIFVLFPTTKMWLKKYTYGQNAMNGKKTLTRDKTE